LLTVLAVWCDVCAALTAAGVIPGRSPLVAHSRQARSGSVALLEAFDLIPVMDCLKLDGMDSVEQCMDNLEPWLAINEDGGIAFSLNAVNGFIGGSVGVVGTVLSTLIKKEEVKDRMKCNYCAGSGQILCGHCLSSGQVSYLNEDGMKVTEPCSNCEGTGTVVCINCQGSGISVPEEFFSVLGDDEMGFTEEDYIGLFDESPKPPRQSAPTPDAAAPVGAGAGRGGSSSQQSGEDHPPSPNDYTGGMG